VKTYLIILLATASCFVHNAALADDFHYKNILIGERASGMGGAFSAISDDPSGLYHNPAGIVFSQENYFSLSANAFSTTTETYTNVAGGQNYTYKSQSLVPVFFGMTQSLGKHKYGFAVIVPNSELNDQEDTLTNLSQTNGAVNTFRRRFFKQDMTYLAGPGFATELSKKVTIGISIFGVFKTLKAIDHQLMLDNPLSTGTYFEQYTTQTKTTYGLLPKLGLQFMPTPRISVGLTAAVPYTLSGSGKVTTLKSAEDASGNLVTPNGTFTNDKTLSEAADQGYKIPRALQLSLGTALFFSKTYLLTGQVDYFGSASSPGLNPQSTLNLSLGQEVYLSDVFALRSGVFTNNANTPAVVVGRTNQLTHVNQLGGTLAGALCKPGSSLTLGLSYAAGTGQGQALGGSTAIQDVSLKTFAVYLTGSYQL